MSEVSFVEIIGWIFLIGLISILLWYIIDEFFDELRTWKWQRRERKRQEDW